MLNRRLLLRGMFAMPAVVAASSLMPIRGIIMPNKFIIAPGSRVADYQKIDKLLLGLKADDLWVKIDRLWLLDAGTEEEAWTDIRTRAGWRGHERRLPR